MPFLYSLFVNGKSLGPYERRMIVGMRVKNIVEDEQVVLREDGIHMTVGMLIDDKLETAPTSIPPAQFPSFAQPAQAAEPKPESSDNEQLSVLGPPSSGMWPSFQVQFGGTPGNPGALGFKGPGEVSYHGDFVRFKGMRRNNNLGMSRQKEDIPMHKIASSLADGCVLEIHLQPGLPFAESIEGKPMHLEFATEGEASELWELLNMTGYTEPLGFALSPTVPGQLM